MTFRKVKTDDSATYIRFGNANHKHEYGKEVESKLFTTGYKQFLREVIQEGIRLENKSVFKKESLFNNIDEGAYTFNRKQYGQSI